MNLTEINQEIRRIEDLDVKNLTREDIERLLFLLKERDKLITAVFHYEQDLSIAEIQLAAKVIYARLKETPYRENLENINCPAPIELGGKWINFRTYERSDERICQFLITTPNHGKCLYSLNRIPQVLGLESSLFLDTAQKAIEKIRKDSQDFGILDADVLTNAFISINSSITNFFLSSAQELNLFSWNAKYSPCFFDRSRILNFRGYMMLDDYNLNNISKLSIGKKYLMKDFAMQVKFLTFWVGLMDTYTFPNLNKEYRPVYANLIAFLLKEYANIYIYDIVTESSPVTDSDNSSTRGSSSNTIRLKIFFTTGDDTPRLIRLDLPHEGHPYVHLNIHTYKSDENIHFRLSPDETYQGEYDGVFDPLIDVLRVYNYFTITSRHTPVADDRLMFREMEYWSAMYNFTIFAMGEVLLGENEEDITRFPIFSETRQKLISLLEEDGFAKTDSEPLSNFDLFEVADGIIRRNSPVP